MPYDESYGPTPFVLGPRRQNVLVQIAGQLTCVGRAEDSIGVGIAVEISCGAYEWGTPKEGEIASYLKSHYDDTASAKYRALRVVEGK